jgi:hypothetical protein
MLALPIASCCHMTLDGSSLDNPIGAHLAACEVSPSWSKISYHACGVVEYQKT